MTTISRYVSHGYCILSNCLAYHTLGVGIFMKNILKNTFENYFLEEKFLGRMQAIKSHFILRSFSVALPPPPPSPPSLSCLWHLELAILQKSQLFQRGRRKRTMTR